MTQRFLAEVERSIASFPDNRLVRMLDEGAVERRHYVQLLELLLPQVMESASTFALAAAHCEWRHAEVKEYLMHHAEEEKTHWRWILQDLDAMGEATEGLVDAPAAPAAIAYIGLNLHAATRFPVGRLAIAAVLEGIGARYGGFYGRKLVSRLGLTPAQTTFLASHGETDKQHSVELMGVIARASLTADDWARMANYARCAGYAYQGLYDAAAQG